jgi:hypothetical protein
MRLLIEHVLHPSARADLYGSNLDRWAALVRWRSRLVAPSSCSQADGDKRIQEILKQRGVCWRPVPGLDCFWPAQVNPTWQSACLRQAHAAGVDLVVVGGDVGKELGLDRKAAVRSDWNRWITTLNTLDLAIDVVARDTDDASLGSAYAMISRRGPVATDLLVYPVLRGAKPVQIFDRYSLAAGSQKPLLHLLECVFREEKNRSVTIFHASGMDREGSPLDVSRDTIKDRFSAVKFVSKPDAWSKTFGHDRFIRCENRVLALGRGVESLSGRYDSVAMLLDDKGGDFKRLLDVGTSRA